MRIRSLLYYISAGFVLGTLAMVLVYYGNRRNVLQLIHGNESVLREYRLSNQLMKLEKELILLDNTLKNGPISSDSKLRPEVLNSLEKIKSTTQRIVTADSISLPAKYKSELEGLVEQKIQNTEGLLGAFTLPQKAASSGAADRGPALSEKIRSLVYRIDRSDRIALAHTIKQSDRQGQLVLQWNLYIIAIALILFTLVFLIIVGRMKRQSELILQLNRSEKKLKEAAWVKENFLANMSHEIRTPLNAILG
ncbi:phospho-acceptor domain-containing protein [Dyadobacter jejuensis]|uniref:histidine kinase n=1 Tax=Dyadobacter jejuensis TaxID=1082580 RepID=A0A316ADX4_9BACT|nr:phospho-acceptor domain-containing protein [Dyadobacter jejuensis]